MHCGTDCDVQLPLSGLPAWEWRSLHWSRLCAGKGIQDHERHAALLQHSKRGHGSQQARFCPECGSRLFGGITGEGHRITASSLDDPTLFRPQFDIFTSDAQPWDHMDPKLPKFEKYAPG